MIAVHSIEGKDIPACKKLRVEVYVLMVNSFQIKSSKKCVLQSREDSFKMNLYPCVNFILGIAQQCGVL